jgi:hypothetical protein
VAAEKDNAAKLHVRLDEMVKQILKHSNTLTEVDFLPMAASEF